MMSGLDGLSKSQLYERIVKALSDTTTFGYNELRLNETVNQAFKDDEKVLNTLQLFCFGGLKDYRNNPGSFIELAKSAEFKLAQLTLVSKALIKNEYTYDELKSELFIENTQEFEKLMIESIYSKIIDVKLYNQEQLIKIYSSIGRDVLLDNEPKSKHGPTVRVSDLIKGLRSFNSRVEKGIKYVNEIDEVITENEKNDNDNDSVTETSQISEGTDYTGTVDYRAMSPGPGSSRDINLTSGSGAGDDDSPSKGNTRKRKIEIK